jgi:hypothetical protein
VSGQQVNVCGGHGPAAAGQHALCRRRLQRICQSPAMSAMQRENRAQRQRPATHKSFASQDLAQTYGTSFSISTFGRHLSGSLMPHPSSRPFHHWQVNSAIALRYYPPRAGREGGDGRLSIFVQIRTVPPSRRIHFGLPLPARTARLFSNRQDGSCL